MCAAPGSKTFQLLEIIHRANEPGSLPSGMVFDYSVNASESFEYAFGPTTTFVYVIVTF